MESTLKARVAPVSPVAPYIGGKKALFKRLVPLIDGHDHLTYAEPFVGMGGIFLKRQNRPKAEIINDRSKDLANLYRILQRHYVAFLDMLRFQLTTRTEFERLQAVDPETLTDLERAARFLYLQRTAFGGKVAGQSFGVSVARPASFDITKLVPLLEAAHERLASVTIECLPYQTFIQRYDRPSTLFFLDPPYWGNESDYGEGMFSRADFSALRDLLESLQGSFIMTLNDLPEVRELFGCFYMQPVNLHYSVGKGSTEAKELIIQRLR